MTSRYLVVKSFKNTWFIDFIGYLSQYPPLVSGRFRSKSFAWWAWFLMFNFWSISGSFNWLIMFDWFSSDASDAISWRQSVLWSSHSHCAASLWMRSCQTSYKTPKTYCSLTLSSAADKDFVEILCKLYFLIDWDWWFTLCQTESNRNIAIMCDVDRVFTKISCN